MATFVKTTHGKWKAIVRRRGWPTLCRTFRLKRDAQDWARHTEDEVLRGIHLRPFAPDRTLFSEALDRYLQEVTTRKKPRTQATERKRIRPLHAYFGRYMLSAITPDMVARYRDRRLSKPFQLRGREPRLPKPATVRLDLNLLSHLFTVAIREWRLGLVSNPVKNVQLPASSPGRERRLEPDEETRLFAALARHRNPMLGWIVRVAIETGMRAGEISGLRLRQVDLLRRTVTLDQTKNGYARTVPLTRAATQAIESTIALPSRPKGCDLVFFGHIDRQGRCGPYRFYIPWWKLKSRLGLHDLRFHDLRHEAVSRFVEAGLSDQQVAAISGHRSMQMLKRYTHLRTEELVPLLDCSTDNKGSLNSTRAVLPRAHRGKTMRHLKNKGLPAPKSDPNSAPLYL